jgi:peroxiredoxin
MSERTLTRRAALALPLAATVLRGADIPRKAMPLAVRKPDGGVIDLAHYKGKVVAIEFLLTTCPHCQRSSQTIEKIYKELGPKGFQPIGIATNDMAHMLIPEFVKKFGLSFPVGYSAREVAIEFLQHPMMLTMYMPQLVLIDRNGMIRFQHGGSDTKFFENEENNLRSEVTKLLAEGAPSGPAAKKSPGKKS